MVARSKAAAASFKPLSACDFPDCGMAFRKLEHLQRHMRTRELHTIFLPHKTGTLSSRRRQIRKLGLTAALQTAAARLSPGSESRTACTAIRHES